MRKVVNLETLEFSSYSQRIAARLIDNILCFGLIYLFLSLSDINIDFTDPQAFYDSLGSWVLFLPLFYLAYEVPVTASRGMTIGKRIMGICVVRTDGLIGIGLDRALIRFCVPMLAGLIPVIGLLVYLGAQLWFFYDPQRQNIADKAARTFVVRVPKDLRTPYHNSQNDDVIDI